MNTKIKFAGKFSEQEKPKSPFSELVDRSLGTGSDAAFEKKLAAYREARQQRNLTGGK